MPNLPKILLVEDENVFRDLLAMHVGKKFAGIEVLQADNGVDAWALYKKHSPDFCIVDLHLPRMDGFTLLGLMASHHHKTRVLILTGHTLPENFAGWPANKSPLFWLDKCSSLEVLDGAVSVLLGETTAGAERYKVPGTVGNPLRAFPLTEREKTVVAMIGAGMQIKEIATNLGISLFTAQTHRRNLMRKLGIHSSTQLTKFALENGFTLCTSNIPPPA